MLIFVKINNLNYKRMENSVKEKVNSYVRKNYKSFDVKGELVIEETVFGFKVLRSQDSAPLFLGSSILG
jgi:hypothetical protein